MNEDGTHDGDDDRAEQSRVLADWTARLLDELGLDEIDVDIDAVLRLAGVVAHSVTRPAAPLTTFIVGYAAGRAVSDGRLSAEAAVNAASATAIELARDQASSANAATG